MTDVFSPVPPADSAAIPATEQSRAGTGAVGLVLGGVLSVQFGAAAAALLFPAVGVAGVVTLRLTIAAVVLLVVCRPRLRGYRRAEWTLIAGFAVALASMNTLFYQAIDRIPLGTAVTLEFLGPLSAGPPPANTCAWSPRPAGAVRPAQSDDERAARSTAAARTDPPPPTPRHALNVKLSSRETLTHATAEPI